MQLKFTVKSQRSAKDVQLKAAVEMSAKVVEL